MTIKGTVDEKANTTKVLSENELAHKWDTCVENTITRSAIGLAVTLPIFLFASMFPLSFFFFFISSLVIMVKKRVWRRWNEEKGNNTNKRNGHFVYSSFITFSHSLLLLQQ